MRLLSVLFLFVFSLSTMELFSIPPNRTQVGTSVMPHNIEPVYAPFEMPVFQRPVFEDYAVNIKETGARQGRLTSSIQKAVDMVSEKGGGRVIIPAGEWFTGRIILRSNVELHLEKGAVVRFSGNIEDYLPVVFTRNEGVELYSLGALIYANEAENIALTGFGRLIGPGKESEIFDRAMNGIVEDFLDVSSPVQSRVYAGENGKVIFLPMFFAPTNCKNVFVEGVTFENTCFWNVVPVYCENVVIRGISVHSIDIPRGDGIDIESSKNVLIEYCTFNTGDDCIAIKAGRCEDGIRVNKSSENIVVRHCLAEKGKGGVVCGSETAGMIRNLYVHDCVFEDAEVGIRFKTRRNRGGGGENIYYERIRMNLNTPIMFDMLGSEKYVGELARRLPARPVTPLTPVYRNIVINDIIVERSSVLIRAHAIPESPAYNVVVNNVRAKCDNLISFRDFDGFVLSNSYIECTNPDIEIENSRNIVFLNNKLVTENQIRQMPSGGGKALVVDCENTNSLVLKP